MLEYNALNAFSLYYTVRREFFRIIKLKPNFFLGINRVAGWVIIVGVIILGIIRSGITKLGIGEVMKTLGLIIILSIGEVTLIVRNGISL